MCIWTRGVGILDVLAHRVLKLSQQHLHWKLKLVYILELSTTWKIINPTHLETWSWGQGILFLCYDNSFGVGRVGLLSHVIITVNLIIINHSVIVSHNVIQHGGEFPSKGHFTHETETHDHSTSSTLIGGCMRLQLFCHSYILLVLSVPTLCLFVAS